MAQAEELKKAFRKVDTRGAGCFPRSELAKVFQELGDWTQEDLDDLFDLVDTQKDGTINYTQLVNWIMQDEELDKPDFLDEYGGDEDSDQDDKECMDKNGHVEDAGIDLNQRVGSSDWVQICMGLDVDHNEAESIYARVITDMLEAGQDTHGGVPLIELVDEVQINPEDQEALASLGKVVDTVLCGDFERKDGEDYTLRVALDQAVRLLDTSRRPAEDAWDVLMSSDCLSHAGRTVINMLFKDNRKGLTDRVKECLICPPLLPAPSGQTANREQCIAKVEKIIKKCRNEGSKFVDPDFNFFAQPKLCLWVDKEAPGYDCTVAQPAGYKRLTDLIKNPVLFKGGVSAGDIKQGAVGTCFLLGALGAIAANNGRAIQSLIIKYDVQVGVYGVRFCISGEWSYVLVDDVMPIDKNGKILYAKSADPDEVWVSILEKAYCKLHTCYEMCDGGKPAEAIFAFFGGDSGKFEISDENRSNPASYFDVLRKAKQRGWLLTTNFVVKPGDKKGAGKCGEAVLPSGLVGGHAYSILKVVDACGVQLVQCRNPWGQGEWKGKYSDENKSGEWTDELVHETGWTKENDGTFWMAIEDFVQHSGGVEYARCFGPDWKKVTQYSHFSVEAMKAVSLWPYQAKQPSELSFEKGATLEVTEMRPGWWTGNVSGAPDKSGFFPANYVKLCNRPVARFDLQGALAPGATEITAVIMLMQPNVKMQRRFFTRKQDGKTYKDTSYPSLQLVILGPDGKCFMKRDGKKRCVSGEVKLPNSGAYRVYCMSNDGRGEMFSLRVYVKDGSATLTEVANADISEVQQAITG